VIANPQGEAGQAFSELSGDSRYRPVVDYLHEQDQRLTAELVLASGDLADLHRLQGAIQVLRKLRGFIHRERGTAAPATTASRPQGRGQE